MAALVYPLVILFLFCSCLVSLLFRRYKTALLFFILVLCANHWSMCIAMHLTANYSEGDLKVFAFNVNSNDNRLAKVSSIADMIMEQDADVVFLSEDFNSFADSLDYFLKTAYQYDSYGIGNKSRGHFFYSKYPISVEHLGEIEGRYSLIYRAFAMVGSDTLLVYGCHFASNNYNENNDYMLPDSIETMDGLRDYMANIELASTFRQKQAELLVSNKELSRTIVMGDMNDVSGSKSLSILKKAGLKDAWWEGGFGYGATIHRPLPYRIEYIIYSNGLRLKGIKKVGSHGLSDHDALVAEFEIE